MRFGSARERIVLRSRCICSRNSGRSFSDGVSERRWSSDSSVTGRTIVKQSRSGKKCVSILRIRFFASICSVNPGAGCNARSRYSLAVKAWPSGVTSCRVKSRTSQRKVGKYWEKSAPSSSPPCAELRTWMCLVRFTTSERLLRAPSSMEPTLLYTKYEDRSRAREKMVESCWLFVSNAPIPSVSMMMNLFGFPSLSSPSSTLFHSHSPFVHGFTVGPTWNPPGCSSKILFIKKLFPVRYSPTTAMMETG
mmetsp:Transcript_14472/g.34269  ORF Transcript_14472/g.34269 Transcript_14472/m.34269 type:complete len:250 (-) Transcript_14472:263-1012(-)